MSWYFGLNKCLKQKLQVTQNKIVRFILGQDLGYVGHTELHGLSLLNVENRVHQLSLSIVHKLYNGKGPEYYIESNFTKASRGNMNTRSNNHNFYVPRVNSVTACSFFHNAIKQWNSLPAHLKNLSELTCLKKTSQTISVGPVTGQRQ